ncbi:hypothetical protein ElyMa_003393100 [Elysia marginata]|uniref:Uncharacterized protein n=1 Tax=Elysia marginata TaxID=1093978 RepID=A0AAV4JL58_9GAST|nr:hypothetical protein ElyMa_003393100 [Elysia marginata]
MASASRTALSSFDRENSVNGKCLGRNGAATNCITAVFKLRFKQGTGDPGGFKTHFKELGVPIGTFVRYVGNRMHILFHLGGIYFLHRRATFSALWAHTRLGSRVTSRLI